jgi:filamentous hemagglutinin family protein
MMDLKLKVIRWRNAPVIVFVLLASAAIAQVQTDGSMGPAVSLSGNMVIGNSLGTQAGANLFHSFSVFNIQTGESALFTSTFPGLTQNVLARVTGSNSSWIDGNLASDIPGADLWLINPNGLAFGKNASLDVQGSFHASTADYLKFEDGKRFNAKLPDGSEILSIANPSAFGFLSSLPAPIVVTGSNLMSSAGKSFSLVGGYIDISGASLASRGGRVDLVSVASPGEVQLNESGAMGVGSFSYLGNIWFRNGSSLDLSNTIYPSGPLYVRGGRFLMTDASWIESITGFQDGGPIDIGVTGDFSMAQESSLVTDSYDGSSGRAGDIRINAGDKLTVTGEAIIFSDGAETWGPPGNITLTARDVEITGEGFIGTTSPIRGSGGTGNISVEAADAILISGTSLGIGSGNLGPSKAGSISLHSKELIMNEGSILAATVGSGPSGDISINSEDVLLQGGRIYITTSGTGDSGSISLNANGVELSNNGRIDVSTSGTGRAGNISIDTGTVSLNDSYISNTTSGPGGAGIIQVNANSISVDGFWTGFSSETSGTGQGGIMLLNADRIDLIDGGLLNATTSGPGNAGAIGITAGTLSLTTQGHIVAGSYGEGDGGTVSAHADSILVDGSQGYVSYSTGLSSETTMSGKGGDMFLTADNIELTGGGLINATSRGTGDAGTITIDTGSLSLTDRGRIVADATSEGMGGLVRVKANSISVDGYNSGFYSDASGTGNGGLMLLSADKIELKNSGEISAYTLGSGNAGIISIGTDSLTLINEARILTSSDSAGKAGLILVGADSIFIDGQGKDHTTGFFSETYGTGDGGDMFLTADTMDIVNKGMIIASSHNFGRAGSIGIGIQDTLNLVNGAIRAEAYFSAGGNIDIHVGGQLNLQDSVISSSANGLTATDSGGNLTAGTPQFMILNHSSLMADANTGNGGNINLSAQYFIPSSDSRISASSEQGLDGKIVIDSPNQVRGTMTLLELPSIDIAALLRERCAAAALRGESSFTIEGLSGIPQRPGDFLTSPRICFNPERKELSESSSAGADSSKKAPKGGKLR